MQKTSLATAIALAFGLVSHAGLYSQHTFDASLVLKAAGLVAVSTTHPTILNIGAGFVDADIVVDVTALEVDNNDEIYTLVVEGSNVAAMTSGSVILAEKALGNVPAPADADTAVGRHVIPFRNELAGTTYAYIRMYTRVVGTVATGINYSAFMAKK